MVLDGAIITNPDQTKIEVTVKDHLFVDADSSIDATGKGYLGAWTSRDDNTSRNDSNIGMTLGGTIAGGAFESGSYAGIGGESPYGPTNATYGSITNPTDLGSGGGGSTDGRQVRGGRNRELLRTVTPAQPCCADHQGHHGDGEVQHQQSGKTLLHNPGEATGRVRDGKLATVSGTHLVLWLRELAGQLGTEGLALALEVAAEPLDQELADDDRRDHPGLEARAGDRQEEVRISYLHSPVKTPREQCLDAMNLDSYIPG